MNRRDSLKLLVLATLSTGLEAVKRLLIQNINRNRRPRRLQGASRAASPI
jgi:hypothetical protein